MDFAAFRGELFSAAHGLQKLVHETMAPLCQEHGLTQQQMHVLVELTHEPGQTVGQLSDRAGILRSNFSPVCRKLEDRGLIERRRSSLDRRSYELQVTGEGRALLERIDRDLQQRYGALFDSEPSETYATIVAGFRALNVLAEKMRG